MRTPSVARGGLAQRAYHEAGHVIVALELGAGVRDVSILSDSFGRSGGNAGIDEPWWKGDNTAAADLPRSVMIFLAGIAADGIVESAGPKPEFWEPLASIPTFPPPFSGVQELIVRGVRFTKALFLGGYSAESVSDYEKAVMCIPDDVPDHVNAGAAWLEARALEAGRLLLRRWPDVEAVRRGLMRRASRGTLSGDEVRALIGTSTLGPKSETWSPP